MKTSKIIFISFFSVIGLFLLSLMIQTDPKNRGDRESREMKQEAFALPSISHLIVNEGCNVRLTGGQTDSIKIGYGKDLVLDHPVFTISGDTLIIDKFPNNKGFYTEVICTDLKSVQISNAYLNIEEKSFSELNIEGVNSTIDINNNTSIQLASIHLTTNSRLWCNNSTLKTVQLITDKSNAEFNINQIAELKAELRDSSELSTWKVLHSDVKTDETSRYYSR